MQIQTLKRKIEEDDYPYILHGWLNTWGGEWFFRNIPKNIWIRPYHHLFKSILKRYGGLVLCNPQYPTQIYSYITVARDNEKLVVFWAGTKQHLQGNGLAGELLDIVRRDNEPIYCPFLRQDMKELDLPIYIQTKGDLMSMNSIFI